MPENVDGAKLRDHREYELDWHPDYAAGLLGISRGYLRNIENGSARPAKRVVGRLSRVYGLPREAFVKKDDEQPEPEKKEPRGEPTHPKRRDEKDRKAPPRVTEAVA